MFRAHQIKTAVLRSVLLLPLVGLTGCIGTSSRVAMTPQQQDLAFVNDPALARFWADEVTPDLEAVVAHQFMQVKNAAKQGVRPRSLRQADYLAISGGGGNGAFAAGYLKGWSKRGDRPDFEVVTGVSTGALAAPFAFLGKGYDEQLEEIYTRYGDGDIMRSRGPLGVFSNSLYDNSPLRALVTRYVTDDVLNAIAREYRLGRRLLVQTTNLDAQRPVVWDISAISSSHRKDRRDLVVNVLLASAAIPAVFPPVELPVVTADGRTYEELHVDGGVASQVFFAPPEIGLSSYERREFSRIRERHLYVIRNGQLRPSYEPTGLTVIPLAQRALDTMIKYQGVADLSRLEALTRKGEAELSYIAIPDDFTARQRSQFDLAYMKKLFQVGFEAGSKGQWHNKTPVTPILAGRDLAVTQRTESNRER